MSQKYDERELSEYISQRSQRDTRFRLWCCRTVEGSRMWALFYARIVRALNAWMGQNLDTQAALADSPLPFPRDLSTARRDRG